MLARRFIRSTTARIGSLRRFDICSTEESERFSLQCLSPLDTSTCSEEQDLYYTLGDCPSRARDIICLRSLGGVVALYEEIC